MGLHRILVVDDSPAVRETIGILLGGEYEVLATRADEYALRGIQGPPPNLIIATRPVEGVREARPFPSDVPVLWIDAPAAAGAWYGASIPPRFSPRQLRRSVAELLAKPAGALAAPPAAQQPLRLQPPFVTAAAARGLEPALVTDLPLHLSGEPGTGKRFIARAVHAARGSGSFLPLAGGHVDAAVLASPGRPGGTVYIDGAERLAPAAQQALLAILEPTGLLRMPDGAGVRLISSAAEDLAQAADEGRFAADLYYRMTVLSVHLVPLRERPEDIPALSQAIAAELAALLERAPIAFTERALERLANYLWFGNLAELEAVLARSVALCRQSVLDADDLLFEAAHARAAVTSHAAPPPARDADNALSARALDLIVNELAHEFKNPLVTIKTFAQHLRRALPRGGDEEQVARLTGDAVSRIDQTLENLLEFTRLETPVPQTVPLSAILNPVLEECAEALAPRGVSLDHPPAPAVIVRGDPQQLAYALTNLVRAVSRDLAPDSRVGVGFAAPAALRLELPTGADAPGSHLASMLDRPGDGAAALPLGMAIANAVLERNGAQVALSDGTPSTVTVRFTVADDDTVVAGNGTAPRSHR